MVTVDDVLCHNALLCSLFGCGCGKNLFHYYLDHIYNVYRGTSRLFGADKEQFSLFPWLKGCLMAQWLR